MTLKALIKKQTFKLKMYKSSGNDKNLKTGMQYCLYSNTFKGAAHLKLNKDKQLLSTYD